MYTDTELLSVVRNAIIITGKVNYVGTKVTDINDLSP